MNPSTIHSNEQRGSTQPSKNHAERVKISKEITRSISRDGAISLFLYALPVALMLFSFYYSGSRPWLNPHAAALDFHAPRFIEAIFKNLKTWGLPAILVVVGIFEFSFGLYEGRWKKNERILDIVCFFGPKLFIRPVIVFFTLKLLPWALPGLASSFSWVPFVWACLIIAVYDDLTQYWYHRLHHQVPWLWRFHRTHHSAPYMGMAMASRQNIIYTIFFSQTYLLAALTYLGLGYAALFVTGIKSLITLGAHSSIPWDKPFYKYKALRPIAWVLERLISTPATHQAHHADTAGDGVGNYKGNFGNMFFLWDIIFGTGIITRRYPTSFGIKHYKEEEWYVQFLWPFVKSRKEGSELAVNGPMVGDEAGARALSGLRVDEFGNTGRETDTVTPKRATLKSVSTLSVFLLLSVVLWGQGSISFERFSKNPIIGSTLLQGPDGEDINGPSLVRTPDWLSGRLGKYYLYFAHHKGKYIRLAYADDLSGPWKIYQPGTLQIRDCKVCDIAIGELKLKGGFAQTDNSITPLPVDSFAAKISRQAAPQIVDVRTPEEFDVNHLNGSINIDLREPGHLQGLDKFDRKRPVFIYAIQNKRSGILAKELRNNGFEEVYELKSGIASWIGAGHPYYSAVKDGVTLADYKKNISDKGLVLVDIGTKYCGLCRQVKGMVDSLRSEKDPSYKIVEIDLYYSPQLVSELGQVQAVPTVLLYKDGKIVWKRTGLTFSKTDIGLEIAKAK